MPEILTLARITSEIAIHQGKELDEVYKRGPLADKVHAWRATLIRRTLQNNPQERKFFRQKLFLPLESVSPVPECVDPSAPVCNIMRSFKVPSPLRVSSSLFDFVGSVDGATSFTEASPGTARILMKGKYSQHTTFYEWTRPYIDVLNRSLLPLIRVDGIFEDPVAVMKMNCDNGKGGCDYWNEEYPVSADIKQAIIQCILEVDNKEPNPPADKAVELNPQNQKHEPDGR